MADSGALRQRRSRAHARNDHQWCREGCTADAQVAENAGRNEERARADLEEAGREDTLLGEVAITLARRLDRSAGLVGLASVAAQLERTMGSALAGTTKGVKLREMREARRRKRGKPQL